MGRSVAVIGRGMVRVTLRGSQSVGTLHGLHVVQQSLVMCLVKRIPSRQSTTRQLPVYRVCDAWRHGDVKTSNVAVGV